MIEHLPDGTTVGTPGPDKKPRATRSYANELAALENRVKTARMLLEKVKVQAGSQDTMAAVIGLLQG